MTDAPERAPGGSTSRSLLNEARLADAAAWERLVTLYAHDDLQSSFDFRAGLPGAHVVDGEVRLERAQLAFNVFAPLLLHMCGEFPNGGIL